MKKSILVTGCAGFIGSNFVKGFKKKYPETTILGIDNFYSGRPELLNKSVIFYEGDIADVTLIDKIFATHKPEYVFHFAAVPRVTRSVEFPIETSQANIMGGLSLLNAARNHKVKRFIFSSSSSIYGDKAKKPTAEKENFPNPLTPYAAQKYTMELFLKMWPHLYGVDTVALRYFNVFGPGQYGDSPYASVLSGWLESIYFPQEGKKPYLEGDGKQYRDFSYVDNVVSANLLAMEHKQPLNGEAFNIACGDKITILQAKELIEKHTGKELKLEKRPARLGDIKFSQANISKAKRVLGYKPIVKFEEGLIRTIDWYKDRIS